MKGAIDFQRRKLARDHGTKDRVDEAVCEYVQLDPNERLTFDVRLTSEQIASALRVE